MPYANDCDADDDDDEKVFLSNFAPSSAKNTTVNAFAVTICFELETGEVDFTYLWDLTTLTCRYTSLRHVYRKACILGN